MTGSRDTGAGARGGIGYAVPMRWALSLIVVAACGSPEAPPSAPVEAARDPFIAFATDFEGYDKWERMFIPGAELDDPIHGGDRSIFVNKRPPKGTRKFPVGTIIVKRMEKPGGQIFAMVKRGGGFNPDGAVDWEWFRIVDVNGAIGIAWRGMGPPDGESYGGAAGGVCNGCHFAGKDDDWVRYPGLVP